MQRVLCCDWRVRGGGCDGFHVIPVIPTTVCYSHERDSYNVTVCVTLIVTFVCCVLRYEWRYRLVTVTSWPMEGGLSDNHHISQSVGKWNIYWALLFLAGNYLKCDLCRYKRDCRQFECLPHHNAGGNRKPRRFWWRYFKSRIISILATYFRGASGLALSHDSFFWDFDVVLGIILLNLKVHFKLNIKVLHHPTQPNDSPAQLNWGQGGHWSLLLHSSLYL